MFTPSPLLARANLDRLLAPHRSILESSNLKGTIPASMGDLTSMHGFDVLYNSLTGSLPSTMENWKQLKLFFVWSNALTGPLPKLPFANMAKGIGQWPNPSICELISNPPSNTFSCPWPEGATSACLKSCYPTCPQNWEPITDADCHGTAPPTPAPMYSCDAGKGTCYADASSVTTQAACQAACAQTAYSCNMVTGNCFADAKGTQTLAQCSATCAVVPTPPPTPAVMYTCDSATGQCLPSAVGTQTAAQCAGSCKCEIPHNCGQLNGTYVCGKKVTDCNVCDICCVFYILPQPNCNECVAQAPPPAGRGCGWPNMTKVH